MGPALCQGPQGLLAVSSPGRDRQADRQNEKGTVRKTPAECVRGLQSPGGGALKLGLFLSSDAQNGEGRGETARQRERHLQRPRADVKQLQLLRATKCRVPDVTSFHNSLREVLSSHFTDEKTESSCGT